MDTDKPISVPLLDNGNGDVKANFMICHTAAFAGRTIEMTRASDSHPDRGMNKIANDFLATTNDLWLCIDADLHFTKRDIDNLLSHDLPLVYGIYPKKQDDTPPCCATLDGDTAPIPDKNGLIELRRVGRGFMLVRRDLLEAMKEDAGGPALRYHNHGRVEWCFFQSGPIWGEYSTAGEGQDADGYPIREWVSEDFMFCDRARSLGIKVIADSRIVLAHEGPKVYKFADDQVKKLE